MAEDLTSTQEINNAKAAGANDPTWDNKDSDLSDISPLLSRDTEKGKDDAGFQQKHYSNGMTFLTVFPDGSAQLFYPSGLLALVVVVTEAKGRVCIVYDSYAPEQPIRALFQSDGRATCYHSNGNIWLNLDKSGGQCLDETGARVQRWRWSSLGLTFPLRPVFLSLNKILGVRVLGQEQVFVSFLSCGQQAKFSVGACCVQGGDSLKEHGEE
ncbi:glutamate-rich protein 6 [Polymixia lowei]